jgi:hypothetical protein
MKGGDHKAVEELMVFPDFLGKTGLSSGLGHADRVTSPQRG